MGVPGARGVRLFPGEMTHPRAHGLQDCPAGKYDSAHASRRLHTAFFGQAHVELNGAGPAALSRQPGESAKLHCIQCATGHYQPTSSLRLCLPCNEQTLYFVLKLVYFALKRF